MDLQQVLLCPKSLSSAVYYKRKLCVHNFTLYDLASKAGYCYVWHEGNGGLDADEFATLVTKFLSSIQDSVERVILWSDGCTYQNRNSTLASAILYFLRSGQKPNLREVHQKFLCRGHTEIEVDSMHAAIEAASSKIEVYTPLEWQTVMKTARPKQPYEVTELRYNDWQTFPPLVNSIRPGKGTGDPVVTDLKHILYTRDGILYSLTHGTPLHPLQTGRSGRRQLRDSVAEKYSQKLVLPAAKIADLKALCQTVIPQSCHAFFENTY